MSARSARVKDNDMLKDKEKERLARLAMIASPEQMTQARAISMRAKFAEAANSIIGKLQPNGNIKLMPYRKLSLESNTDFAIKMGINNKPIGVRIPERRTDLYKATAEWPIGCGPAPDLGPAYGTVDIFDFQTSKVKLPVGNYFDSTLFKDVTVTEAQSPDDFYVKYNGTAQQLEYLEDNMKEWYDAYWIENANIDPKTIFKDCIYACYVEEKDRWYRARVDDFIKPQIPGDPLEILVQLLDYGYCALVKQDCLLLLRKVYCDLPIQAASAALGMEEETKALAYRVDEIKKFRRDVVGKTFQVFLYEQKKLSTQTFVNIRVALLEIVDGIDRPYNLCSDYDDSP